RSDHPRAARSPAAVDRQAAAEALRRSQSLDQLLCTDATTRLIEALGTDQSPTARTASVDCSNVVARAFTILPLLRRNGERDEGGDQLLSSDRFRLLAGPIGDTG